MKFKQFRASADFRIVGQTAKAYVYHILKLCARYDHPFASANIIPILENFEVGNQDFNDGLLAEFCRHRGCKLVTNDGDFTEGDIEILTANQKLLTACR